MLKIKIAIFPGRFEPITLCDLDILKRALRIFDKIIVLVLNNPERKSKISIQNRLDLIKTSTEQFKNIETDFWEKLLIDYVNVVGACAIIKCIKNTSGFNNEFDMYATNKILNPNVETVFFPANPKYRQINSMLVEQLIAAKAQNLELMIPKVILPKLTEILSEV